MVNRTVSRYASLRVLAAGLLLLLPAPASAHLVTTGMGPVYDGIAHLLLTPEDLVPVLALALYAGLRGARYGKQTLLLLPVAWLAGGLAGHFTGMGAPSPWPILSFLFLGALVAGDLRLSPRAMALLTMAFGVIHGFGNGMALKTGAGIAGLLGIMVMLFVLVALMSALVVSLERVWTRMLVRVAGSWIFASGLLMFGWTLRGQA